MIIKGIKPRTQFAIDAVLFGLLSLVAVSAVLEHGRQAHVRWMWHVVHGISGGLMVLTLGLHLFLHLPWIESQLARVFGRREILAGRPPQ